MVGLIWQMFQLQFMIQKTFETIHKILRYLNPLQYLVNDQNTQICCQQEQICNAHETVGNRRIKREIQRYTVEGMNFCILSYFIRTVTSFEQ